MQTRSSSAASGIFCLALSAACAANAGAQAEPDRTILPIKEPQPATSNVLDVRNATAPERFQAKALDGAPNVLVVLIDDLGFAGTGAYGGPIATPPSTAWPARA